MNNTNVFADLRILQIRIKLQNSSIITLIFLFL